MASDYLFCRLFSDYIYFFYWAWHFMFSSSHKYFLLTDNKTNVYSPLHQYMQKENLNIIHSTMSFAHFQQRAPISRKTGLRLLNWHHVKTCLITKIFFLTKRRFNHIFQFWISADDFTILKNLVNFKGNQIENSNLTQSE